MKPIISPSKHENFVAILKSAYDALSVKDPSTYYMIMGVPEIGEWKKSHLTEYPATDGWYLSRDGEFYNLFNVNTNATARASVYPKLAWSNTATWSKSTDPKYPASDGWMYAHSDANDMWMLSRPDESGIVSFILGDEHLYYNLNTGEQSHYFTPWKYYSNIADSTSPYFVGWKQRPHSDYSGHTIYLNTNDPRLYNGSYAQAKVITDGFNPMIETIKGSIVPYIDWSTATVTGIYEWNYVSYLLPILDYVDDTKYRLYAIHTLNNTTRGYQYAYVYKTTEFTPEEYGYPSECICLKFDIPNEGKGRLVYQPSTNKLFEVGPL